LLNTEGGLKAFRAAARSAKKDRAFEAAYAAIQNDPRASADYQPRPAEIVEVSAGGRPAGEKRFKDDGMAAYLNALQWAATGKREHRDKAIEILDGWARTYRGMRVVEGRITTEQIEAAWALPVWTNTAEIIRHFDIAAAGWNQQAITVFDGFIERLYQKAILIETSDTNRGVSGALAALAAGVFQDDRKKYATGLARLQALMPVIIRPDGEVFELHSRDCHHPQYSLTAFVQAAEIATNQGDDSLWLASTDGGRPRLARGLEYMGTALTSGTDARDCRRSKVLAGYAGIAVLQYSRLGIPLPVFKSLAGSIREDQSSYQFIGWSAAIRSTGQF
jgi:hypothetical protein